MWRQRASVEEAAARARVLAELGRNGVGGRLRSGYLHRRLAWETCGEVVFEDLWPDRAGEDDAGVTHDFADPDASVDQCLACQAWAFRSIGRVWPRGRREQGARKVQWHDYEWGRAGGPVATQRRTSSRWMACNTHFPSKPRRTSGIARPMNVTSSIKLEARSAGHRCFRAYQIDVGADLFGTWLVEMSYGRIGRQGRSKIRSFTTIEGAEAQVDACLRKRATAPRRHSARPGKCNTRSHPARSPPRQH